MDSILVVVDKLTNGLSMVVRCLFIAKKMAKLFIRKVIMLYRLLCTIVSDREQVFLSNFWMELFKIWEHT